MSRKEAADILGISENSSKQEIIFAHKKEMQKHHPDKGGSKDMASKINAAKDILLS
jgi:DnaJ-class molecular chaperone